MALADFGGKVALCKPTLDALRVLQREEEPIPVRLVASYALLRHHDNSGIEALIKLLQPQAPVEARKAAAFVLAAEPPTDLPPLQRDQLTRLLILALEDPNGEAALHAAQALRNIATPAALSSLCALLDSPHSQVQIAALTALEEVASRTAMRRVIQHHTLPTQVVLLLRSETPEVRRQASYTLAACGGEYAAAVLGTTLLNNNHPAHLEAIEALRLLHGALRTPTRTKVVRWLLRALRPSEASSDKDLQEEVQVTALDSLGYLAWQARAHSQKRAWHEISTEISHDGTASQLLACPSAWVRQRAVEMLSMLDSQPDSLHTQLLQLLHSDDDSGVRACVAYTLGQTAARWAIPDLIQTLLDPDEHVAETALNALSHLATPDDPIINYVMEELAACGHTKGSRANRLSRSAHALLKKWRHKL